MDTHSHKALPKNDQSVASEVSHKQSPGGVFQFEDKRPETLQLQKLQSVINNSDQVQRLSKFQRKADKVSHQANNMINSKDTIQRAVITTPPNFVINRNVATAWKGGGAYADTPAVINGKVIPPSANKEGMILEPQLTEIAGQWRTRPVDQHVGCRIEAPGPGPWTYPGLVGIDELDAFAKVHGAQVPLRTPLEQSHPYTLIVHGRPSDAALHHAIVTHEQHHVEEQNEVIDNVLVPWDAQVDVQAASAPDPLFAGQAYDQLGLPKAQEIANTIVDQLRSKGLAFHDTDEGKEPDIDQVVVDEPNAIYHVYLTPHT